MAPVDPAAGCGLAEMVARLEALIGQPHIAQEYVRLRIDLLKAQWAVRQALARTPEPSPQSEGAGRTCGGQGPAARPTPRPSLDPDTLPLDRALLASLFCALCESAGRHGPPTEDLRRLASAVESDPSLLETLARKAAFGPDMAALESLARATRVLADVLLFVGRTLAAPFIADAARRLGTDWSHPGAAAGDAPRCPACGSPPTLAVLRRGDGGRLLVCGLCATTWEFARLVCPCCGTAGPEGLGLLRLSPEDPWSVETCERCGGYIKTVDERRLPAGTVLLPAVEETATLFLDLLAEQEGYVRRLPYVLSG